MIKIKVTTKKGTVYSSNSSIHNNQTKYQIKFDGKDEYTKAEYDWFEEVKVFETKEKLIHSL